MSWLAYSCAVYVAKRKEKSESLQILLQKEVVDLDTLLCPKETFHMIEHFACALHSFILPKKRKKNIVLTEKHSCISIG